MAGLFIFINHVNDMKIGFERDDQHNPNQILDLRFPGANAAFLGCP